MYNKRSHKMFFVKFPSVSLAVLLRRRILIDLTIAILLSNICFSVSSIDTMNKGFLLGSMKVHQNHVTNLLSSRHSP
jgi:hypothetical protein